MTLRIHVLWVPNLSVLMPITLIPNQNKIYLQIYADNMKAIKI